MQDRVLLVSFSGWYTVDAKDAKFLYLGDCETEEFINGEQWLDLSIEDRSDYLLVKETEQLALDGSYDSDVKENKEE